MLELIQQLTAIKNGNFCLSDLFFWLNLESKIGLSEGQLRARLKWRTQRDEEAGCQGRENCLVLSSSRRTIPLKQFPPSQIL